MKERKNLPESELDIMLVIWNGGGSMAAPDILEALDKRLTFSALHSYLRRLVEKGFLRQYKMGRVNCYTSLISEEEYRRQAGGSVLDKLYNGSIKTFAAALWDGGKLSREDISELQEYLKGLERGDA